MPTHSIGRSHRSRCAGLTIGSIERTASVQSSNIRTTHPQPPSRKIVSDFERDHATSPCLSTAIGNRQLPEDERWAVGFFGFLSVRRGSTRAGRARCRFSIKPLRRQEARWGRAFTSSRKSVRYFFHV